MDGFDNNGKLRSTIDTYTSRDEVITTNNRYDEAGKNTLTTVAKRKINTGEVSFDVYLRP